MLPNVQHHCLQHGLDVMFVDPLLGNTEDPTLDPENLEVRIKELANCSEESIGPIFLVKYISGYLKSRKCLVLTKTAVCHQ